MSYGHGPFAALVCIGGIFVLRPTTIQKSYDYTRILRLYKNPTGIEESYKYTRILQVYKNPTSIEESYDYTEIKHLYRKL